MTASGASLADAIASVLPSSSQYNIHHVSHPATKSDALYSPPLHTPPAPTTLTSHILGVSSRESSLLVYAIEVLIWQTSTITTLFVSKGDSTGFLGENKTPGISPIRAITTAFLQCLLEKTYQEGVASHISLFARAQDQYLFPNSVKISTKHILSDRQLIRWWARVLDPILKGYPEKASVKGYILVPGLDRYESKSMFPPASPRWIHGHPYGAEDKPVRECIPHFPDDPKSRFMMELEVDRGIGWKGVTSLQSFWELMAFRQECSLGKSVGFLSLIVPNQNMQTVESSNTELVGSQTTVGSMWNDSQSTAYSNSQGSTPSSPRKSKPTFRLAQSMSTYTAASMLKNPSKLKLSNQAQMKRQKSGLFSKSKKSLPASVAGGNVISKKDYDRLLEALTNSDFGSRKLAKDSSEKWIELAGTEQLPEHKSADVTSNHTQPTVVNVIVAKKRNLHESERQEAEKTNGVNLLQPSMVRKKSKLDLTDVAEKKPAELFVNTIVARKKERVIEPMVQMSTSPSSEIPQSTPSLQGGVTILTGRKKVKPQD